MMEEIPRAVPWVLTAISAMGNVAQMVNGWRRGRVDVDKIRQEMTIELIEKARELNTEWEVRNGKYIARLADEKEQMLSVNQRLQCEVEQLRKRVSALETVDKERVARIRALEDELRAWQERAVN
ncbi:MAG: hypothetical protein GWN93_06665 [Deltaproteobacteria bacterium]|nr:hypothetical protein [Deltaproteobacteria bacterium]